MIERKIYLEQLKSLKDNGNIKIINGVSKSGKRTLLNQYLNLFVSHLPYIYLDLSKPENKKIKTYQHLIEYLNDKHIKTSYRTYLVICEIQKIKEWDKVLNYLSNKPYIDAYITISSDFDVENISNFIKDKINIINVYPLSFCEYISQQTNKNRDFINTIFLNYLKYGGIPMITHISQQIGIESYLSDFLESILIREIIKKHKLVNSMLLNQILEFLANHINEYVSIKEIYENVKSNTEDLICIKTVNKYIQYLIEANLICKIYQFNLKNQLVSKTKCKYYFTDIGLKNSLIDIKDIKTKTNIANLVFCELLRRKLDGVYVGTHNDFEIDFVVIRNKETIYIQVCRTLLDEKLLERETRSLLAIKDNYRKIILTLDEIIENNIKGIEIINIIDFLLSDEIEQQKAK